jgi:DNA-directed RNA polymerase I subunit RPA49
MATKEELAAQAEAQKPIPPPSKDAKIIQDVYRPSVFIGDAILNAIDVDDWVEAARSGTEVVLPSKFVASRLNAVAGAPDGTNRLRLLRYLLYLVIFFNSSKMRAQRKRMAPFRKQFIEATDAPEVVVDQIRQKFTDGDGQITTYHVSLLMTHVLCSAAILENFEFDMEHLRMDLGQSQDAMTTYFQELGGKVRQAKSGTNIRYVAKLALPLQFPRVGGGPRRGKRR